MLQIEEFTIPSQGAKYSSTMFPNMFFMTAIRIPAATNVLTGGKTSSTPPVLVYIQKPLLHITGLVGGDCSGNEASA